MLKEMERCVEREPAVSTVTTWSVDVDAAVEGLTVILDFINRVELSSV